MFPIVEQKLMGDVELSVSGYVCELVDWLASEKVAIFLIFFNQFLLFPEF